MTARLLGLASLVTLVAAALGGCLTATSYTCEADAQCVQSGLQGACEAGGRCSFPDEACPSGKRYGEYAGGGLGGACVDGETASETASSGESETATTGGCVDPGGACTADEGCCGPCTRCDQGICVVDVGAQGPCDPCFACDAEAACAPAAPGSACDFACDALAFGTRARGDQVACLRGPAIAVPGSCDGAGACTLAAVDICLGAAGEALFECASACALGRSGCQPGVPVADLGLADLCALEGTTAACGPSCADGAVTPRACDGAGLCVDGEAIACSPYACADDGVACNTQCMGKADCAAGFNCTAQTCQ